MTIKDFENALHNPELRSWLENNVDNFLIGGTSIFQRENKITMAIVTHLENNNVLTQTNYKDFFDNLTLDVGEAAHNGMFQPAQWGPEHIISDYYKRFRQGHQKDYYALMYLMDIERLSLKTNFTKSYATIVRKIPRNILLQSKFFTEQLLNRLPGKIQIHEPFHNLKSPTESTILNYDIYVMKMKFNKETALEIYHEFNKEDFFKRVGFDYSLLD